MQENVRLLSVAEAAAALGVSTDAIRKRLARGTIEGEKVDGQWRVILPDDAPDIDAPPSDTGRATIPDMSGQASDTRIADLQATIEDLRGRLDWSQAEISELRIEASDARKRADMLAALNQGAQDRIRELEALTEGHATETEAVESPVSDDAASTGISTHVEPDTARRGALQRLWHVITGQG